MSYLFSYHAPVLTTLPLSHISLNFYELPLFIPCTRSHHLIHTFKSAGPICQFLYQITTLLRYSWSLFFPNIEIQLVKCFTPILESSRVLRVNLTPEPCTKSKINSPTYTVVKFTLIHTFILRPATQYQSFMGGYDHADT